MLIIPADSRYSKNSSAFVTWLLVMLNVLIYIGFQINDQVVQAEALEYYLQSDLPKLEIKPYLKHLNTPERAEDYNHFQEILENGRGANIAPILFTMQADSAFLRKLHGDQVITPEHQDYDHWKLQRRKFDSLYSKSFTFSYVLKPDQPSVITLVSHMFMHGSIDHLIGNMVFLALIGPLVELALGPALFAFAYLVTGLCAAAMFISLNMGQATSVLGASGAIAGVMGMFAFLFGLRKVRFFYTIFVYFGFVLLPAIFVFPYWFLWEWLQYILNDGSNVAYEAHAGGLLGGAAIGGMANLAKGRQHHERIDKPLEDDGWETDFRQAVTDMRALNLQKADRSFLALHKRKPEDLRPLLQLYRITCLLPPSPLLHQRAEMLLRRLPDDRYSEDQRQLMAVFDEYFKRSPEVKLSMELLLGLAAYFARQNGILRFDEVLKALLQAGCNDRRLGEALKHLTSRSGLPPRKRQHYRVLEKRFFPSQA